MLKPRPVKIERVGFLDVVTLTGNGCDGPSYRVVRIGFVGAGSQEKLIVGDGLNRCDAVTRLNWFAKRYYRIRRILSAPDAVTNSWSLAQSNW